MNCCPSHDELQQLVAEQLNGAWREELVIHVEKCAACQEALAHLSDEDEVGQTQVVHASSPTPLPASEVDFVQHLKENPPRSEEASFFPEEKAPENIEFPGPPTEKGPLGQLGCFAIRKELGAGRYGVVYQAYDELDRLVALKILRPEFAASCLERARFEHEGRKAAAVKHDHIVTIHQVGHTAGFALPYLVMEYVDGEALSERLHRHRVVPAREAACIVRQMALALSAAHTQGFVHRDVKPSNILVEAGTGRAKLTDFGLARLIEAANASTNGSGRAGTPQYMSPEHINTPHLVDGRSDLYSLGVTLYELLTGERPFRAVTSLLWQEIVHDEPRPPRKLNDAIARDLETITLKCLAKEPGRRYQTTRELADDLQRWLDGKPIQARPVGVPGKAWRWCRCNPFEAAVAVLGVVALMAVTAFSISVVFLVRLDEEHRQLQGARRQTDRLATVLALEAARKLCEDGEVARGMLNPLRIAPQENPDLQHAIRWHLAAWYPHICRLRAFLQNEDPVVAATFSSNGNTVLTVSGNSRQQRGHVRLWDAATGRSIGRIIEHKHLVTAVSFSPDGRTILTGSKDYTVRRWNAATGEPVGGPFLHDGEVMAVGFNTEGNTLLTASHDQTGKVEIRLWDSATGKYRSLTPMLEDAGGERRYVELNGIAFSPDGKTFVTGDDKGNARLWDAATAKELRPLKGHKGRILAVAFSPDGKRVLTGSEDGTACLWDSSTGKEQFWLKGDQGPIWAVAFDADGTIVVTGKTVRLWDSATGKQLAAPVPHAGVVTLLARSIHGNTILTRSSDNKTRLWGAAPANLLTSIISHPSPVQVVAFSPEGRSLLTACYDVTEFSSGKAYIWNAATKELVSGPLQKGSILAASFSRDGKTVLIGNTDNNAWLWEKNTGHIRQLPHDDWVRAVALSPNGKIALTGSTDHTAGLWDVSTALILWFLPHPDAVYAVAFSHDGRKVLTGCRDGKARIWDAATGIELLQLSGHGGPVRAVAFSPDDRKVLTGSEDNTAWLWDAATGMSIARLLLHHGPVHRVAFNYPSGTSLLTGSHDCSARLWDAATGSPLGNPLLHQESVEAVAFSPDSMAVLTGSQDNTARLWDAATGAQIGPTLSHPKKVLSAVFSPNGRTVLTGCEDNNARLWEIPAPLEGETDRIHLWIQVITGVKLDLGGTLRHLEPEEWDHCRRQLEAKGGSPVP
jgi:WD40 repeat protein